MTDQGSGGGKRLHLHPILIVVSMLLLAAALTHILPAGKYERHGKQIVAGSYHEVSKENGLAAIVTAIPPSEADMPARAAGVVGLLKSIPAGMTQAASLIFMIMFVGGMFGILRTTGVIDAGVDRLLQLTAGNVYLLGCGLLLVLSCGSTFLGFSSEYIAIIPIVMDLARRLGLPNIFAVAVVATADFIGYNASVTNPIALAVAQPLAGVPLYSGIAPRLAIFTLMIVVAMAYLAFYLRRFPRIAHIPDPRRLSLRQVAILLTLVVGAAGLVLGTGLWSWHTPELGTAFLALSIALAAIAGLAPAIAADAFLEGMKGMLLPTFLIGLAGGIGIMLQTSQVLDTVVEGISTILAGHSPALVASSLMFAEMVFGILMPSVSAKAAVSMPIMAPIAQFSGVSGQVSVTALVLGSGVVNMITPTNPLLLAFLAAAKVDYAEWARFILPLFLACCGIGFAALYLLGALGF
ncbi:YfcC family protein [Sphingomonas sp. PAMC 26617]|uniref:YfcC family protein n=1 Tax=Sphingomonas sp. PAMC 26617 TaxID=1112216 RepID=UPI000287B719|nr:YfcC family protein [Sphingomonas sp. PAMC 26617]